MSTPASVLRQPKLLRLTGVIAAALLAVSSGVLAASPGSAVDTPGSGNVVTPGNFTGFGFDQCVAPSQAAMDAWLTSSPFWAVGIYISGDSRGCPVQPNLDPAWVSTQLSSGWRLLPLTVGPQASCTTRTRYLQEVRIDSTSTSGYAAARTQGAREAETTVAAAQALGIAPGSTLWYDLEAFDTTSTSCRESALSFLSGWTTRMHALGYVSGVYSSAASGIRALDDANVSTPGKYAMPDQVWIADWNGQADVYSDYVRADSWMPHQRVHQYRGGHTETHGGVTINIDSNFLDVGRGSVAPRPGPACGVQIDFPAYDPLIIGSSSPQVGGLQCLLRKKGFYSGDLGQRYTLATHSALQAFLADRGLPGTASLSRRAWTAVFADGRSPVLKHGSAGFAVRRVQRALNARLGSGLTVTGVFEESTTDAVVAYQERLGLPLTGVVADTTWVPLRAGRR